MTVSHGRYAGIAEQGGILYMSAMLPDLLPKKFKEW